MLGDADRLVRSAESAYASQDIEAVLALFDPNVVFFWNGVLQARGLTELRRWHETAFANARDYRIRKTLRAASGDTIAVEWADSWIDRGSGTRRRGCGAEFWTMKDAKVLRWDAYWRGHDQLGVRTDERR
jgi:nuclear transport factor 2 (NTF2) superfamily protein